MKGLFFFLSLFALSYAAIDSLALSGKLSESGQSSLDFRALFSDSEGRRVFLNLSGPVDSIVVKDRSGLILEHQLVQEGNSTLVYATVPVDYIEFEVVSDSFTAKDGSLWDFELAFGTSERVGSFVANVSLPPGAVLKSANGAVQGGGDSLLISWKGSMEAGQRARLKAAYELAQSSSELEITTVAAFAAVLLAAYMLIRARAQSMKAKSAASAPQMAPLESDPVFRSLDETDKEIIRLLHREGGRTTQARLYLDTHLPKATLSRRLASLEGRGLIQRSQKGNRKLVSLAK
ncbi:MAG: winged helix-turn-helix transcriptional regulator [Candidatus Micrarchaeota archaeon]